MGALRFRVEYPPSIYCPIPSLIAIGVGGPASNRMRARPYLVKGPTLNPEEPPLIDRTFTLNAIVDAHRYMESNQQKGKIVVTV